MEIEAERAQLRDVITSPSVTIVIVTWNSASNIEECLSSMMDQSYSHYSVLVVDSNSADGTVEIVRRKFPSVHVIASEENLGYRGGNRLGMHVAAGDYVVLCNDDVTVEHDWLAEMVRAMASDPEVGMVTPRIMMYDQPNVMNAAGNELHYSGMYGPRAKKAPVAHFLESTDVAAVSGCCFMIRRDLMIKAGLLSEDFDRVPQYWHGSFEDVDLGWHIQMMGYRLRYVASSAMYHKYTQPRRDLNRVTQLGYGFLLFVLRNYEASALFSLSPIILLIEASFFVLALLRGTQWIQAQIQKWRWFVIHRSEWMRMRKAIHPLRKRSYWQLFSRTSPTIDIAPAIDGLLGRIGNLALNLVFLAYHHFLSLLSRVLS